VAGPGMRGRLNSFQRTMLQWNELHPYSAVHVVQIAGPIQPDRLRDSIASVLESRGLSNLTLDEKNGRFEYRGGPAAWELRIVSMGDGSNPRLALAREIEGELNRPFDCVGPFQPFRFFAMPAGSTSFLGLVYFHPVADAESVVFLLRDIVHHLFDGCLPDEAIPPDLYPDRRCDRPAWHPGRIARRLLALPDMIRAVRRSHRARYRDPDDLGNGFTGCALGSEAWRGVLTAARVWEVTVNDLLLALLMRSLGPAASGRARARRRRRIGLGCVVNLRRDLGLDGQRTFGLFLGTFVVTHEAPDGMPLRDLARELRRQTGRIKQDRLYLTTPLDLGLARLFMRFLSPGRRKTFYAKHHPLWGGITNMNLNPIWQRGDRPVLLDYVRGVSTGPVTPLALCVTTIGDRTNLGLSYRRSVFSKEQIEAIKDRLLDLVPRMPDPVGTGGGA
jgi:hypothetical protein